MKHPFGFVDGGWRREKGHWGVGESKVEAGRIGTV